MQSEIECRDWNSAWRAAMAASSWLKKGKESWNRRATSFASNADHKSDYSRQFLKIIRPRSDWRVLDVGCGPGTIAIPMASMVAHITGLDFSPRMLAILQTRCAGKNITHIKPVEGDLEDDWQTLGIEPHDVVIASRSFVPVNLSEAITKMNRFATQQVFISAPVGIGRFDRRIMAAVGRSFRPGPDYIFILNQLHSMGIYARLDFTVHAFNRTYADHHDALNSCSWMIPDMTIKEKNRLSQYLKKNLVFRENRWILPDTPPVRWAVISWDIPERTEKSTGNSHGN